MNTGDFTLHSDDDLDEICGRIFSTVKGMFVFICAVCDRKYSYYERFLLHYSKEHLLIEDCKPNVDLLNTALEVDTAQSTALENLYPVCEASDPLGDYSNVEHNAEGVCKEEPFCQEGLHSSDEGNRTVEVASEPSRTYGITQRTQKLIKVKAKHSQNVAEREALAEAETFENSIKGASKINAANESQEIEGSRLEVVLKSEKVEPSTPDCHQQLSNFPIPGPVKDLTKLKKYKNKKKPKNTERRIKKRETAESIFLQVASGRSQIKCLRCPAIFTEAKELQDHMKDHENWICPRCSSGFLAKHKFEQHMRSNGTEEYQCRVFERPRICRLCNFAFEYNSRLKEHLELHFGVDDCQCECQECGTKFNCSRSLDLHMRVHARGEAKPHKCDVCGGGFATRYAMKKHTLRHFQENKNMQCEFCPKKFFTRTDLIQHVKFVHTTHRPFLCSDCGASFPVISKLTAHKDKHHSVRQPKFKCEICSKMFFEKQNFRFHMMTHDDERKHVCSICKAAFKMRKSLACHMKIHANRREYKCELCSKDFNQRPGLISHMKSVHNEKL